MTKQILRKGSLGHPPSRFAEELRCYKLQLSGGVPCGYSDSRGRWSIFGLGEGVPPRDPCDESDPTNKKVLDFIKSHWDTANAIAAGLQTTPENILGLSGEESTWGKDPKIPSTNNFFNLHPIAPGQVGVYPPGTPPKKYGNALAVFPSASGYEASAQAFAGSKMGKGIKGIVDSLAFADKLAKLGYNGVPPENPNFVSLVRGAIDSVLSRINCPQLSAKVKKQK